MAMLFVSTATAQEWTRFRGPNGTGESETTRFPASWTEKDLNWRIELPGIGHSSPVLWGDKLFILQRRPEKRDALRPVHQREGRQADLAPRISGRHASSCTSTAAMRRSRPPSMPSESMSPGPIPNSRRLMALDHSGNEVWTHQSRPLGQPARLRLLAHALSRPGHPELLARRLQAARRPSRRRSFIVAVEQSTGKVRWRTDRKIDSASFSVPTVRKNEAGQDELLCNTQAEGLFALDPKTGKENWSAPVLSMRSVSCPLYVAGLVFGTTGSGGGGHYWSPSSQARSRRKSIESSKCSLRGDARYARAI